MYRSSFTSLALTAAAAAALAGCNAGGNSATLSSGAFAVPTALPTTTAAPGPTPSAGPSQLSGTVNAISSTAFGAAAAQTGLSGATVVVGPVLIVGATPPASLPAGDVSATTDANGRYSVTIAVGQVSPTSAQAVFVPAVLDLSGVTPPSRGYYVSVFAPGSDGVSANLPIPVHAFSGVDSTGKLATQRVTTATSDEAAFLALLNHDRVAANAIASPLIFDETAQEAARLHVNEEATGNFYCHYNAQNVGPSSRYLSLFGIAQVDENIGKTSGQDIKGSYTLVESQFIAESSVNGGHYTNIIDATRAWAGVTTFFAGPTAQYVAQELVSPHGTGPYVYPLFAGSICPPGTTVNNS